MHEIVVNGNVGGDPELRYSPGGVAFTKFGVADSYRNKVGDKWEDVGTHWWNVTVFGQQAENVAESVRKGDHVVIVGRLDLNTWKDKETGEDRKSLGIIADHVAVSLRWATAEAHRLSSERGGPDGPTARKADDMAAEWDNKVAKPEGREDYGPDEAPF